MAVIDQHETVVDANGPTVRRGAFGHKTRFRSFKVAFPSHSNHGEFLLTRITSRRNSGETMLGLNILKRHGSDMTLKIKLDNSEPSFLDYYQLNHQSYQEETNLEYSSDMSTVTKKSNKNIGQNDFGSTTFVTVTDTTCSPTASASSRRGSGPVDLDEIHDQLYNTSRQGSGPVDLDEIDDYYNGSKDDDFDDYDDDKEERKEGTKTFQKTQADGSSHEDLDDIIERSPCLLDLDAVHDLEVNFDMIWHDHECLVRKNQCCMPQQASSVGKEVPKFGESYQRVGKSSRRATPKESSA